MDANIDQKFVCSSNGLTLRFKANIASIRPPTGSRGRGVLVRVSGLLRSCKLLEACSGSSGVQ
eukprot:11872293-Karenia_brevis.AAC.1